MLKIIPAYYLPWLCILQFLFIHFPPLSGQTPEENLKKYWHYRDRFLGKDGGTGFISLGFEPGQGIPVSGRDPSCNCEKDWILNHHNCEIYKGHGKLEWGDATVFIGYYLAMLSMEYANLKNANQDTESTLEEIYITLKALDRLDAAAEVALGMKPDLNGFFIRDDVPGNFHYDKAHPTGKRFWDEEGFSYDCVGSAYSCGEHHCDDGNFTSLDQVISLLFGFAFVNKFVGDVHYNKVPESMNDLASKFTDRMVNYLIKHNWRIIGPNGDKISNRWGGDCRAFNHLIALSADNITGQEFKETYAEGNSMGLGKFLSGTFNWAFSLQSNRNHAMIFNLITATGIWDGKKMAKRSRKADQLIFALTYSVMNRVPLHESIDRTEWDQLVNSAPWDGPCFDTPGCEAPLGWRSSDRWWHPKHKNGNPYGLKFEYSGMDYMLLYNLYHYYYHGDLPIYKKKVAQKRKRVDRRSK